MMHLTYWIQTYWLAALQKDGGKVHIGSHGGKAYCGTKGVICRDKIERIGFAVTFDEVCHKCIHLMDTSSFHHVESFDAALYLARCLGCDRPVLAGFNHCNSCVVDAGATRILHAA